MTSRSSSEDTGYHTNTSDYDVPRSRPLKKKTRKNPRKKVLPPQKKDAEAQTETSVPEEKKAPDQGKKRSLSPPPVIQKKARVESPVLTGPTATPKRVNPVPVASPRSDAVQGRGLLSSLLDAYWLEQQQQERPWRKLMQRALGHVRRKKE